MENKDIDKKVEATLASLDGIKRAEANAFLLTRVLQKMKQPQPDMIQPGWIWKTAACLVLILGLNAGIYYYSITPASSPAKQNAGSVYFNDTYYSYTSWKN